MYVCTCMYRNSAYKPGRPAVSPSTQGIKAVALQFSLSFPPRMYSVFIHKAAPSDLKKKYPYGRIWTAYCGRRGWKSHKTGRQKPFYSPPYECGSRCATLTWQIADSPYRVAPHRLCGPLVPRLPGPLDQPGRGTSGPPAGGLKLPRRLRDDPCWALQPYGLLPVRWVTLLSTPSPPRHHPRRPHCIHTHRHILYYVLAHTHARTQTRIQYAHARTHTHTPPALRPSGFVPSEGLAGPPPSSAPPALYPISEEWDAGAPLPPAAAAAAAAAPALTTNAVVVVAKHAWPCRYDA